MDVTYSRSCYLPYTIVGGIFDGYQITTEKSWVIHISTNTAYGRQGWEIVEETQSGGVSNRMMWAATLGGYYENPWKLVGAGTRADRSWKNTHHYGIGEIVEYNDEMYVALGNTVNDTPDEQVVNTGSS